MSENGKKAKIGTGRAKTISTQEGPHSSLGPGATRGEGATLAA